MKHIIGKVSLHLIKKIRTYFIMILYIIILLLIVECISSIMIRDKNYHAFPLLNISEILNNRNNIAQRYQETSNHYFVYDATLGFRFKANSTLVALEGDEMGNPIFAKNMRLITDKYGFIPNDTKLNIDYKYEPSVYTVLVTGGSTVSGWGATDNRHTWVAILEQLLKESIIKQKYKDIRVINSGVFGYRAAQELRRFQEETLYLKPNLVIMFNGINEPWSYKGNPVDFHVHAEQYKMMNYFNNIPNQKKIHIFMPYTQHYLESLFNHENTTKKIYSYKQQQMMSAPELYVSKLIQFDALCKAYNIDFLYYLQPIMGADQKKLSNREEALKHFMGSPFYQRPWIQYEQALNVFYDQVEEQLSHVAKVNFHSARHMFESYNDTLYSDPRHYNDLGQNIIAHYMYDEIIRHFQRKEEK